MNDLEAAQRRKPGRPRRKTDVAEGGDALILRAAMGAFAEKGFSGTTVREVAGRCGVDPALINHHFGSKHGLWEAVVNEHAEAVLSRMIKSSSLAADATPGVRLQSILNAFVDITASNKAVAYFLLRELVDQSDRERYRYINRVMMAPIKEIIFPWIERAIESDEIAPFDPNYLFVSLTSAVVSSYASLAGLDRSISEAEREALFVRDMKKTIELLLFR